MKQIKRLSMAIMLIIMFCGWSSKTYTWDGYVIEEDDRGIKTVRKQTEEETLDNIIYDEWCRLGGNTSDYTIVYVEGSSDYIVKRCKRNRNQLNSM